MDPHDQAITSVEDDSGCQVDWSWLEGREIAAVTSSLDKLTITFRDGETLSVQASVWQDRPFLAFNPWKPRT